MKNTLRHYYNEGIIDEDTYLMLCQIRAAIKKVPEAEYLLNYVLQNRGITFKYDAEWEKYLKRRKQ